MGNNAGLQLQPLLYELTDPVHILVDLFACEKLPFFVAYETCLLMCEGCKHSDTNIWAYLGNKKRTE